MSIYSSTISSDDIKDLMNLCMYSYYNNKEQFMYKSIKENRKKLTFYIENFHREFGDGS